MSRPQTCLAWRLSFEGLKEYGKSSKVLAQIRRASCGILCLVLAQTGGLAPPGVSAQSTCAVYASHQSPRRGFVSREDAWDVHVSPEDLCSGGSKVSVISTREVP